MDQPLRSPESAATRVKRRSRWWTSRWVEAPAHRERLPKCETAPPTWTCSRCCSTSSRPVDETALFVRRRGRPTTICRACGVRAIRGRTTHARSGWTLVALVGVLVTAAGQLAPQDTNRGLIVLCGLALLALVALRGVCR